ncbi:triosephosphate isomerase, chloroplastic-like [Macadamia integrifolia]|uniref:triosephosphate isomerase, chloroplastic-like n=1 Tax=Macadamia integrifolia TaxID=60698 RepID=UPI001C4EB64D|nr:triosephosphate isomerase, chloroplastic-like [Macadamia integrifolia]
MAVVSTSLASQLSGPKSAISSSSCPPPQFSGLRRSSLNLKLDQSQCLSATFFQQIDSHLRLSAGRRPCRGVVTMGASGKFFVGGNWKCVSICYDLCFLILLDFIFALNLDSLLSCSISV